MITGSIIIDPGEKTGAGFIVVPGSVGLPVDGGPMDAKGFCWANYVILNLSDRGTCEQIEFHRTSYNATKIVEELGNLHYPVEIIQFFERK
jgi:hypothetical protein